MPPRNLICRSHLSHTVSLNEYSSWNFKQIIRPTENSRQTRWLDSVDENDIVTGAYQLIYHVEPISKPE